MAPPEKIPLKFWRWDYLNKKSAMDPYSAYNYTDNFLSPIPISDLLIFYCGNLMLHKNKKWKWQNIIFLIKKTKQCQKSLCKQK